MGNLMTICIPQFSSFASREPWSTWYLNILYQNYVIQKNGQPQNITNGCFKYIWCFDILVDIFLQSLYKHFNFIMIDLLFFFFFHNNLYFKFLNEKSSIANPLRVIVRKSLSKPPTTFQLFAVSELLVTSGTVLKINWEKYV